MDSRRVPTIPADRRPTRGALGRAVRALIPRPLRLALRELRELTPAQRRVYVRRWLLASRRARLPDGVTAGSRIVFLCYGNILRSPMAAALFKAGLRDRGLHDGATTSAGVAARTPREAHRDGRLVAPEFGVSLEDHLSAPVSEAVVAEAALLVAMDRLHEAMLLERFPAAASRVVLLGEFDPEAAREGIPIEDPYGQGQDAVRASYVRIHRSIAALIEAIVARDPAGR